MNDFQTAVRQWVLSTFGQQVADDIPTRCFRFFEEAGELCQSLGMRKEDAIKLVDYVWGRPLGEPEQELGGVLVTLAAMSTPADLSMGNAAWKELARCWQNQEKIRAKQKSKAAIGLGAKSDPLPGTEHVGKYVTLHMAVCVGPKAGEYLPQQTTWRIMGVDHESMCWIVSDPHGAYPADYILPMTQCSEPREAV